MLQSRTPILIEYQAPVPTKEITRQRFWTPLIGITLLNEDKASKESERLLLAILYCGIEQDAMHLR